MKFKGTQSCDAVIKWAFFGTKSRDRLEKTLRNELVCVEWDVKAQLSHAGLYTYDDSNDSHNVPARSCDQSLINSS